MWTAKVHRLMPNDNNWIFMRINIGAVTCWPSSPSVRATFTQMTNKLFKTRIYVTLLATLFVWSLLIWDYFHGGVPSHHLLAREEMPAFSNWWGGILIPVLTWLLTGRIQKRLLNGSNKLTEVPQNVWLPFLAALLFGVLLSISFTLNVSDLSGYMMLSVFVLALFFPLYRSEYLLGFVLGLIYSFGGVLPILIGSVLICGAVVIHKLIRPALMFVWNKLRWTKKHQAILVDTYYSQGIIVTVLYSYQFSLVYQFPQLSIENLVQLL